MKRTEDTEIYDSLADVYDTFMKDVPYEDWCGFIAERLDKYGIKDGLVCDLGCGSGILTTMLSDRGYDMTGVDRSASMLGKAMERRAGRDILYISQDIRHFELYGTMRAIISTCDTLNYVTDKKDLRGVFSLVANYLDPGGLFIFDLHTPRYYKKLGDGSYADVTEDAAFIWENDYSALTGINSYDLTLFIREDATSAPDGACDRYVRRHEEHVERAWSEGYIKSVLKKAGLELLETVDDYSNKNAGRGSERIVYITRKPVAEFT